MKKILALFFAFQFLFLTLCSSEFVLGEDQIDISAPSAILIEASTQEVIYEKNPDQILKPASITKIMTLLLAFEAIDQGKIHLDDEVITSNHAKSMGGSQVFLEEGEIQTVDTLIKCITVASGNDAAVALAEHIAGSEEAFVEMMNQKASKLGLSNTHFEDCCGLTDSDTHVTSARDVAMISRELILNHSDIYNYSKIWSEDIVHNTNRGSEIFTLNSTNKLLKQYPYLTGLKTGSTSSAKYCYCATANKDGIDLIAVVMAAPTAKNRFADALKMLQYGFAVAQVYQDDDMPALPNGNVDGGESDSVHLRYEKQFSYLDVRGSDFKDITKEVRIKEQYSAPISKDTQAGEIVYFLNGEKIGDVAILFDQDIKKAQYKDYFIDLIKIYLM